MLKSKTGKKSKTALFIFLQTAFVIFGLAGAFVGTYAWFTSNRNVETTTDFFSVINNSISINSIQLIKFDYQKIGDMYNYLEAEKGTVGTYNYNDDSEIRAFGYYSDDDEDPLTDDVWHTVVMNRFDPVRIEIGEDIRDQLCNAVYVVTVTSDMPSTNLKVYANYVAKAKTETSDIFLSDCLDFDIYTVEEVTAVDTTCYLDFDVTGVSTPYLLDFYGKAGGLGDDVKYFEYSSANEASQTDIGVNFEFVETYVDSEKTFARFTFDINPFCVSTHKFSSIQLNSSALAMTKVSIVRPDFYPTYISDDDKADPTYDPNFAGQGVNSVLFHKIGYLSSQETGHAHMYGTDKSEPLPIHDNDHLKTLNFTAGTATFYINVNYAPSQLEQYSTDLINGERRAIYDFCFSIDV